MILVTKEEFYTKLDEWGDKGLDPIPTRERILISEEKAKKAFKDSNIKLTAQLKDIYGTEWVCQKTRKIFGLSFRPFNYSMLGFFYLNSKSIDKTEIKK